MEEIHPKHVWPGNTAAHAHDKSMIGFAIHCFFSPAFLIFCSLCNLFVKQAAVRAMDTIQDFVKRKLGNQVDKFFVAGASKVGFWIEYSNMLNLDDDDGFYREDGQRGPRQL